MNPQSLIEISILISLLGMGGAFIVAGGRDVLWGWRSRNWPRMSGTILSAKIQMVQREQSFGPEDANPRRSYRYRATLRYGYSVGDANYVSTRIGYGKAEFSDSEQMSVRTWLISKHWKAGNAINVFYDPKKPQRAVLEPGFSWTSLIITALGAVQVSAAFALLSQWPGYLSNLLKL